MSSICHARVFITLSKYVTAFRFGGIETEMDIQHLFIHFYSSVGEDMVRDIGKSQVNPSPFFSKPTQASLRVSYNVTVKYMSLTNY